MKTFRALAVSAVAVLVVAALPTVATASSETVRFATFNASLNRNAAGEALADLSVPGNAQADAVAEIIQRVRPDVLLINEFDYYAPTAAHPDGPLVDAFRDNYLAVAHNGAAPIDYPYSFVAESNTGHHLGLRPQQQRRIRRHAGRRRLRRRQLRFRRVPGPVRDGGATRGTRSTTTRSGRSSTSCGRTCRARSCRTIPRRRRRPTGTRPRSSRSSACRRRATGTCRSTIGGETVHFLASHPTPPVFDGLEDRNGTRNNDEIRLWADYITPGRDLGLHLRRRRRPRRPQAAASSFVIAGDQNSDPLDGDSIPGSIQQLLDHPLVNTKITPSSAGGPYWADGPGRAQRHPPERSRVRHGRLLRHPGLPAVQRTRQPAGGLRPAAPGPRIVDAGVFWPDGGRSRCSYLTGTGFPVPSSDHRAVWVDVSVPG